MQPIEIPAPLRHCAYLYKQGKPWLEDLPAIVACLLERWDLSFVGELHSNYNYVARVKGKEFGDCVLKVGCPHEGLNREIETLQAFGGHGAARVLAYEPESWAALLAWVEPGTPLSELYDWGADALATKHVANGILKLREAKHIPAVAQHISDWNHDIEMAVAEAVPFAEAALNALSVFEELKVPSSEEVLLHGDLHHYNLIYEKASETYVVIDPKGIVGDPAYEVGALFKNPCHDLQSIARDEELARKRITILSEMLGHDRERIRLWAFYGAVLSAVWTVEENAEGWHNEVRLAEMLWSLRV